ncbi:uncharacterized protein LOC127214508 [Phodopus roborovskii]|uniref:uncharacterized protein LOC127214505 n=1 Tax=Phodopus roborovskii TaxID=109678 RepID=UPI0021E4CA9F|nr:uncharacterized protein LOC127214505 [Phodopus roborovskii]XP_051030863.1 uncharacterized protein LOC127214508 [Phodopus roborovskii]
MDLFTTHIRRFTIKLEFIYKLSELLSSISELVFAILIASCQYWRLWEFEEDVFVFFGLWEAYYLQEFNVSGTIVKILLRTPINSTWTISPEFQCAQTLIMWAILMKLVVLIFCAIAIKISCMRHPFVEWQIYCYKISAFTLCVSSLFTLVSVSWNHFVDHYGQTTLDFPPDFPVKKEDLIQKHYTRVFPVGVLIAIMSLIGVIFYLSEIRSLKLQSLVKTKGACIVASQ